MWGKKPGRDRAQRQFFYRELTGVWAENGLEKQAYTLVKHGNFTLSDVKGMTLEERNAFTDILVAEFKRRQEEMEAAKGKRAR